MTDGLIEIAPVGPEFMIENLGYLNSAPSLTTYLSVQEMAAFEPAAIVALLKTIHSSSRGKQQQFENEWNKKVSPVATWPHSIILTFIFVTMLH